MKKKINETKTAIQNYEMKTDITTNISKPNRE